MRYRKKPIEILADQWFKNGDHPQDDRKWFTSSDGERFLGEGAVVRYYRTPDMDGQHQCKHCGEIMHNHGWIETFEGGHIVCPGDWIITGVANERYPCKLEIFAATYEPVEGG